MKIPFDEPKFRFANDNSILLCIEGGSAGRKIGLLNETVCFGNKLCNFNPIGLDVGYLYYFLQSPQFLKAFSTGKSGIIGGVSGKKN